MTVDGARVGATDMLLTALGELVLRRGTPMWTATLVAILDAHGFGEKNARQAVARQAERGLLRGERIGRQTRWSLTERAREILVAGTERIFDFSGQPTSGRDDWLLVAFSVPEEMRLARVRLRRELGFLGFGFPGPGVAVCAHAGREAAAAQVLEHLGVAAHCLTFRGAPGELTGETDLVERAWDLEDLAGRYREFLVRFDGVTPGCPADAGRAVTDLVHQWRQFPFIDPELPEHLLPARWPGRAAKELFDRCHRAWSPPALAWVEDLEAGAGAAGSGGEATGR